MRQFRVKRWVRVLGGLAWLLIAAGAGRAEDRFDRKIVLGAGCFWCVQAIYQQQPGVIKAVPGYAGGTKADPSYAEVSTGKTGHAEVVEVTYDPRQTDLKKILGVFWRSHDPTDPRGVAPDFGTQYRSIILYESPEDREIIEASRKEVSPQYHRAIATEIAPLKKFYPAEEYHQDYVKKHPEDPYVQKVTCPRLRHLGLKVP